MHSTRKLVAVEECQKIKKKNKKKNMSKINRTQRKMKARKIYVDFNDPQAE